MLPAGRARRQLGAQIVGHRSRLAADLVHRSLADAGIDQLERGFAPALFVQDERRLDFIEALSNQPGHLGEAIAHLHRAVLRYRFTQKRERRIELLQRVFVRLQISRVAGQKITTLRGFSVDDELHHIVQPRFHLERSRALSVRDIEAAIAEFRKHEHGDRHDHAEREWQQNLEGKRTGHPVDAERQTNRRTV